MTMSMLLLLVAKDNEDDDDCDDDDDAPSESVLCNIDSNSVLCIPRQPTPNGWITTEAI